MRYSTRGFTLLELMTTIAVLAILVMIAVLSYQKYAKAAHLNAARAALVENVHFMEQYYARHHSFKASSTTWPDLPRTATAHFDIAFTGKAQGVVGDRYTLSAVPNASYRNTEDRYLTVSHNSSILLCSQKTSQTYCEPY